MSKRSQIQHHVQKLGEIGDIMRAMRNVSFMETHKLARFLNQQRQVLASIEQACADFGSFYPECYIEADHMNRLFLAIGSERGFCGDFNDSIVTALHVQQAKLGSEPTQVLLVGSRLVTKIGNDCPNVAGHLEAPSVVEEVQSVLMAVVEKLMSMHSNAVTSPQLIVTVLYHEDGTDGVTIREVPPVGAFRKQVSPEGFPPLIQLRKENLYAELAQHYLWAQMHHIFYSSLMAENRSRLRHMEQAIQRLEEKTADLQRHQNILRQEEITEEIEVIMLNADAYSMRLPSF